MKIVYFFFLVFTLSISAQAQNDNPPQTQSNSASESKRLKNILSAKIGLTDPVLALTYERLLTSNLGIEVQLGFLGGSIGPKVYLPAFRSEKVNFHTGVIIGSGYFAGGSYGYLPIGINRITKKGFVISLDVGPQYLIDSEEFLPGATFKIGKAF
ncbi:hypothetical protein ACFOSV_06380 [Algoriphagus namhaensis]|uniref:DUF3575 domain-containing protein n=1 Tax=Algoriphagus namhaensis TaxID=915353 RepID=A0ABV8AP54_9BACT